MARTAIPDGVRAMKAHRRSRGLDIILRAIDSAEKAGEMSKAEARQARYRAHGQNPGIIPTEQPPEVAQVPT